MSLWRRSSTDMAPVYQNVCSDVYRYHVGAMTRAPRIGLTMPLAARSDPGAAPSLALKASYPDRLQRCGALPVPLPSTLDPARLRAAYELLDGVLLPGGADVAPERYGMAPHPALGQVDPALDGVDLALARWAFEDGKPLLGICRGAQVINVAFGGTLYQDLASERPGSLPHATRPPDRYRPVHEVEIEPDSALARVVGATRLRVNSTHHQAVRDVAPGWRVVGRAPDGVVESIEPARPAAGFVLAVQWHPEELWQRGDAPTHRLFEAFVRAACGRAGLGSRGRGPGYARA
jgi:putative glutamine amidotransferase